VITGTSRFAVKVRHAGISATAVLLLSGGAILRGGSAAADANQDDQFLALLAQQGIPALEGVPSLVDTAHKVCHALNDGVPADRVRDALVDYAVSNDPSQRQLAPGRLARTEARFIVAAVGAYCPSNRSKLGALITHSPSGWNAPTRRAPDDIRPSTFHGRGTVLAALIAAIPPGEISEPNPPRIPAPPPPVEHLLAPPPPAVAAPRPQQPPRPKQPPPAAVPGIDNNGGVGGGYPAGPPPSPAAPPPPPPPSPAAPPPPAPPLAPGYVRLAP
jgi:hypothetical protein